MAASGTTVGAVVGRAPAWTKPFLAALRAGATVREAADRANISFKNAYAYRKRAKWFDDAWVCAVTGPITIVSDKVRTPEPPATMRRANSYWRRTFLKALTRTSNVTRAAQEAGIPVATAYTAKRTNPNFARQWRAALFEGYEELEMEVLAHLRGTLTDRKIDVANAIRQLAVHRKTVSEMRIVEDDSADRARMKAIGELITKVNQVAAQMAEQEGAKEGAADETKEGAKGDAHV